MNSLQVFSNGLDVYNGLLGLYGYRYNYIRAIPWVWQAFDIVEPNTYGRPDNTSRNAFFIGYHGYYGANLYMVPDGKVHYCKRRDGSSRRVWPSLHAMLKEEIQVLNDLYDKYGVIGMRSKDVLPEY